MSANGSFRTLSGRLINRTALVSECLLPKNQQPHSYYRTRNLTTKCNATTSPFLGACSLMLPQGAQGQMRNYHGTFHQSFPLLKHKDELKQGEESKQEEESEEIEITLDDGSDERKKRIDESTINREDYTNEVKVRMPDLGVDGDNTIVKWYKKEGDIIYYEDVLCDIQTANFTYGMESGDEEIGIMGTIKAPVGEPVRDDDVICVVLHHKDSKGDQLDKQKVTEE